MSKILATVLIAAALLLVVVNVGSCCTMSELNLFLERDATNTLKYEYPAFICGHFSERLIANASREGIEMYPAYLYMRGGADHMLCSTSINGSLVFIEPQGDIVIPMSLMPRLCRGYILGAYIYHSMYRGSFVKGIPAIEGAIGVCWG